MLYRNIVQSVLSKDVRRLSLSDILPQRLNISLKCCYCQLSVHRRFSSKPVISIYQKHKWLQNYVVSLLLKYFL